MSKMLNFNVTISGENKLKNEVFIKYTTFILPDNENNKKPVGRNKGPLVREWKF